MLDFPQSPMLARPASTLPRPDAMAGGCVYEPKFDGYRALLFIEADGCRVQSRRGHDITRSFRDIATAAAEQLPTGLVLDGELVVWRGSSLDFAELHRPTRGPASFVAFDILAGVDSDVRGRPLSVRRHLLEILFDSLEAPLQLTPQTRALDEAQSWLADYTAANVGIEGLVVKGRRTTYDPGSRGWLKVRIRDTVEVIVGAVTGSIVRPTRLVIGVPGADGAIRLAGTTVELTGEQSATVGQLLRPPTADHPWTDQLTDTNRQPVEPSLVVEISVDNAVHEGRWRHPTKFVRARPDLSPEEIDGQD